MKTATVLVLLYLRNARALETLCALDAMSMTKRWKMDDAWDGDDDDGERRMMMVVCVNRIRTFPIQNSQI